VARIARKKQRQDKPSLGFPDIYFYSCMQTISTEMIGNKSAHCHFPFPATNFLASGGASWENGGSAFALRWRDA
jgi:hypothetical protein